MASVRRIKRRVLRQAVDENVSVLRGGMPARRRRSARFYNWLRRGFMVATPIALLTASYVATRVAAGLREPPVQVAEAPRPVVITRAAPTLSRLALATTPMSIPAPIDRAVLPLAVRRVVLDPGHGGEHRGTASSDGQMLEKDLTLDIADRLRRLLETAQYEVVLTRLGDDTVSLGERGDLANRREGDIFVSIHVNWLSDPSTRGVETFYLGPTDDPRVEAMAVRENAEGEVRLAEYREALDRVYAGLRRDESRALAESVQRSLLVSQRTLNPEVRNRGVKSAPFGVLTRAEMPAILAEVSCLSNEEEARQLGDASYRQYLAEALFEGIRTYSEALNPGAMGS